MFFTRTYIILNGNMFFLQAQQSHVSHQRPELGHDPDEHIHEGRCGGDLPAVLFPGRLISFIDISLRCLRTASKAKNLSVQFAVSNRNRGNRISCGGTQSGAFYQTEWDFFHQVVNAYIHKGEICDLDIFMNLLLQFNQTLRVDLQIN